jgi:outer membrane biosynthesis protein TonB
MRGTLIAALALALAACSETPPPPKPKPAPPKAEAPVPPPAPVAETKPEPPKPDPNKDLASRVKNVLESPESKLPSGAIDVTAAEGKITLWGAVATDAQRSRAAQIARKVEGVSAVDNQLKVVRGS